MSLKYDNEVEFNEDNIKYMNFLAFLSCIKGVEENGNIIYPTVSATCKEFGLYDENVQTENGTYVKRTRKSSSKYRNETFILKNFKTNEIIKVKGNVELQKLIGIRKADISTYINKKTKFKRTYV